MNRIREENEALLYTVAELERNHGILAGSVPMVPRKSLENSQAELEKARAALAQKEILQLRMKQVGSTYPCDQCKSADNPVSRYSRPKQMNFGRRSCLYWAIESISSPQDKSVSLQHMLLPRTILCSSYPPLAMSVQWNWWAQAVVMDP